MDGQKSTALGRTISVDDPGAPEAAVLESQSEGVVYTLNKLLEEAQTHLDAARGNETAGIQSFETLKIRNEESPRFEATFVQATSGQVAFLFTMLFYSPFGHFTAVVKLLHPMLDGLHYSTNASVEG